MKDVLRRSTASFSFLTDYAVTDRIIDPLKLTFVAERPAPAHMAYQGVLVAAETGEYFS